MSELLPDPLYVQRTARDIKRQTAAARKQADNARKRVVKNSRSIPIDNTMETASNYNSGSDSRIATVSYIGGKKELILTRNLISLLLGNKLITPKIGTLLYILMEYGAEEVSSGLTIFEQSGEFAKFCLAYDLDIDEAYRHLISFKTCKKPLESMALQLHFDLAFPGE